MKEQQRELALRIRAEMFRDFIHDPDTPIWAEEYARRLFAAWQAAPIASADALDAKRSELLQFLIEKGVINVVAKRMVDRDPSTLCAWVEWGKRKAVDISNDHADAAMQEKCHD